MKLSWQQLNFAFRCIFGDQGGIAKRDISIVVDSQLKYQQVSLVNCWHSLDEHQENISNQTNC